MANALTLKLLPPTPNMFINWTLPGGRCWSREQHHYWPFSHYHQATVSMVRCGCCYTPPCPITSTPTLPFRHYSMCITHRCISSFSSTPLPLSHTEINTPTSSCSHDALWVFSSCCFTVAVPAGFDLWFSVFHVQYSMCLCVWLHCIYALEILQAQSSWNPVNQWKGSRNNIYREMKTKMVAFKRLFY